MCDKKVLGVKSYKFILLEFVGFVAGTILSILLIYEYMCNSQMFCFLLGIIAVIFTLVTCYLMIRTTIRPQNMVEYDDKGVYLNFRCNKTVYILFKDIDHVYALKVGGGRGMIYKFGTLGICTKTNRYKIGVMDRVEEAKNLIYSQIA